MTTNSQEMTEQFDRASLLERVEGDEELLAEMIKLFLADAPRLLDAMRNALQQGDMIVLERSAHSMKGAASNLSANITTAAALNDALDTLDMERLDPPAVGESEVEVPTVRRVREAERAVLPSFSSEVALGIHERELELPQQHWKHQPGRQQGTHGAQLRRRRERRLQRRRCSLRQTHARGQRRSDRRPVRHVHRCASG